MSDLKCLVKPVKASVGFFYEIVSSHRDDDTTTATNHQVAVSNESVS